MNEELKKDMVLFAKYIRRLGVKYPKEYITGFTGYNSTAADVNYTGKQPKKGEERNYSWCMIEETGNLIFKEW